MAYTEERSASLKYRDEYYKGINSIIEERRKEVDKLRAEYINPEKAAANRDFYRKELIKLFGWPLTEYDNFAAQPMSVKTEKRFETDDATVFSVQLEVMPELWFYGLYYENKKKTDGQPFVIVQHGGAGGPETLAEMWGPSNYSLIADRIVKRGANAFLPGLLLWAKEDAPEWIDKFRPFEKDERDYADFRLRQVGGSITAVEILAIRRVIKYYIEKGVASVGHIGMTGLSYGGFYTLMTTACEPIIDAAYISCQFSDRYTYDQWPDWIFDGAALKFLDAEIAALIAPRPLFIEEGDEDDFFKTEPFISECRRAEPFYAAAGAAEKLKYRSFRGGHQFATDDDGVEFLMNNLK